MFIKILYIATGGALGSSLRFCVQYICKIYFPYFPIGTLIVNIIGSFFVGLFTSYLSNKGISEIIIKYFLIIGVLGSFTTFSAFSNETIELLKQGRVYMSLNYIILSLVFSILAAYIGLISLKF